MPSYEYDEDFTLISKKAGGGGSSKRKNGTGRKAKQDKKQNQSKPSIYSSKHIRRSLINSGNGDKAPKESHTKNKKNKKQMKFKRK